MNITIPADFFNIVSFIIGAVGFVIAIWQIMRTSKIRKMYKEKCETRCKDLVETTIQLNRAVNRACSIKSEHFDSIMSGNYEAIKTVRPLRQLSDEIHSIDVSDRQLIRFCERLNEEHEVEFGTPIFEDIRNKFREFPVSKDRVIQE